MYISRHRGFRKAALVLCVILWMGKSATAQKPMMAVEKNLPLSAEQTAQAIGLLPLFGQIKELAASSNPSDQTKLVALEQQVLMQVTAASLQVHATTGQIDSEIADTKELENYLSGRRDSKVDLLNLINLGIGGTLGTASSALGGTVHDRASAVTGVVAGGAAAALSILELRMQRGQAQILHAPSNMLSEVFDRPPGSNDMYPPVVLAFMHSVPPDDKDRLSRQEQLIHDWVEVGRIPPPDSAKGREKIEHLTSLPGQTIKQSISDLDDRQAMLYDLRVRLNYIQQDLATLLDSIPAVSMRESANLRSK